MLRDDIEIIEIEDFYSHKLNNQRNIKIYLPPSYNSKHYKYYPVLYTHDGQNVFEGTESYSGDSWDLHKRTEYLIENNMIEEIIIIAVDNMKEKRLHEYAYEDGTYQGKKVKAEADNYEKFITEELMPVIEEEFRVKESPENTALMGSSMGGLVTFNIGLRHPDLFGKIAVMSPSFWWGNSSPMQKLNTYDYGNLKTKIWLDTGDSEGKFMSFSDAVIDKFIEIKNYENIDLVYYLAPGAVHNELDWGARVHCPLLYFFGETGEIEEIKLHGKEQLEVGSKDAKINPVINFDSGFKMTVLDGKFKSLNSNILEVDSKGNLTAKRKGKAEIKFKAHGFKAAKIIEVVDKLKL
jgi:predicted alpha/beta superfamily hydrolase